MSKQSISELLPKKEKGKLNIYMHISENSGVGYYRQYLPAVKLRESGIANVLISDFRWGEGDHKEPDLDTLFEIANWADIIVVGRKDIRDFYAQWGGIREFFNIPIVMDTDDNVRFVRPSNPGYVGYFPGSEAIMWNKVGISKVFDAVTVSTQDLVDFHKKECPRIYLLPNNLDIKHWNHQPRNVWEDGFTTIGFIGSSAHGEGVKMIKKPIVEILKKYPKTKFLITGAYNIYFTDVDKELLKRIEWIPWIKLQDWPTSVKKLGIDIGLAPLADNMFNRAKSNLRWMEYSLAHMCTIVSPVKPYLCVKDGETGFIAREQKDWQRIMEKLINNPNLRKKVAEQAYQEICTQYNIDTNIVLWDNTYKEIHKKFHEFWGAKKQFIPLGKGKFKEIK